MEASVEVPRAYHPLSCLNILSYYQIFKNRSTSFHVTLTEIIRSL